MGKKLLKKQKQKKKFARDEEDSEDEIEENEEDGYEEDGFVVPDADMDEGGYQPMNLDVDPEAPDAEIESELASSDYDIMDDKVPSKKLKKLHKGRRDLEDEEIPKPQKFERKKKFYPDEEREEDIDNFIERDEYEKAPGEQYEGRRVQKSLAHNIFSLEREEEENDEERIEIQKKNIEQRLTSIYGKEELEEEYATEKDKIIKLLDYPERLLRQYSEEQLSSLNRDVDLEAEWIIDKMKTFSSNMENIGNIKKKITLVLEYFKKDFFDIPFIALYRKMYYEPELSMKDIWKIFELDKEWTRLMDYKQNVKKQWSTVIKFIESKKVEFMERRYLDNAKSITELKDMEAFIAFTREFHRDEIENEYEHQIHRPNKISVLEKIKDSKIHDFARKFALTSHEMAINLELVSSGDSRSRLIPPPDPNYDPAYLSFKYINNIYDQELKVMTVACKFLAIEMVSHPFIRSYARNYFIKNCTVSTEPTEEGKNELNVFHPSFRVKRLRKKPVEHFTNDLFLDIVQCEMKNLITVKIECEEDLKDISERLNTAYNFDNRTNFSSSNLNADTSQESLSSKWKIMREEVIRMLVVENLFPEFIKEIRAELIEKAENYVIQECCTAFNNLLLTGPYKKQKLQQGEDEIFRDDESPKVMSFIYDSSKNEVYCAVIDQNGEVLDYYIFNYLANKPSKNTKTEEKELYYDEHNKIRDLIEKFSPDLIVIGANDLKCKYIKDQIIAVDPEHMLKNQGEKGSMWITFGDITVPRIFSNSTLSDKKLNYLNMFMKQAVSLGRFKQNPLAEILQLWHEDVNKNNCLSIPLHPLQKMVNKNKLADALEMEAIKVTNAVGIEINKAYEHFHLRGALQFISGLGPRKATYILDRLMILKGLQMRMQLLANSILGKRVFMNCAAFFKIKTSPDWQETKKYNLLDMTRIHPESYPLSNKLASSAVEDELKDNEDHILALLRDPKKFNMLELKEFIKKSEEKMSGCFKSAIGFIIFEFNNPFKDPRPPHKDLTPTELFYLLVGDENIRPGHIVLGRVVRVDSQHVKCRLLNDLESTVWIKDIFEDEKIDQYREQEMKDKYKEGMLFEARIKSINENTFKVDLETKPSVMSSHKNSMQVHLDKYFELLEEDYINKSYKEEIKSENKKYIPRNIKYPAFKNITFLAAIEYLRSRELGDYVFRPSSKGINNITLTWVFYKHVYSHVDIYEEDKIPGATIGSKLRISNDVYFSLDEIIDRFIKPCQKLVREISSYRKFYHTDSIEEFERRLKEDKNKDPSLVHYLFTILPDYPQYIILGYSSKINHVIKEYIKVKPRGLLFHGDYFSSIEDLVVWFKKNYGEDSYREYIRKIKPPAVEERRKKDDQSELNSIDFPSAAISDTFDNNLTRNLSKSQFGFDGNRRSSNTGRDNNYNNFRNTNTCNTCQEPGHYSKDCPKNQRFVGNKRERSQERDNQNFKDRKLDNNSGWGSSNTNNDDNSNTGWSNFATSTINNDNVSAWGQAPSDNMNNYPPENNINNDYKMTESSWNSDTQNNFSKTSQGWDNLHKSSNNQFRSNDNFKPQNEGFKDNKRDSGRDGNYKRKNCFNCNEEGHLSHECPKKSREGNNRKGTCYNCGEEGHLSRDCQKPREKGNRGGRGRGGLKSPERPGFRSPRKDWKNDRNEKDNNNQAAWGSTIANNENTGWSSSNINNNFVESSTNNFNNESSGWGSNSTNENNMNNFNKNQSSGWGDSVGWGSQNMSNAEKTDKLQESVTGWGNHTSSDSNLNWNQISRNENIDIPPKVESNVSSSGWGNNFESGSTNNDKFVSGWGSSDNSTGWNANNQDRPTSNDWVKTEINSTSVWGNSDEQSSNNFRANKTDFVNKNDNYSRSSDNKGSFRSGNTGDRKKRACFNCGEEGHNSRDCPNKQNDNNRKRICFNCKEEGHNASDCKKPRDNFKKRGCFNCGEEGHISNDCQNKIKKVSGGKSCFSCGEEGHFSNDCPNKGKRDNNKKRGCFSCGEEGHMISNCPNKKDNGDRGNRNYRGRGGGIKSPNRDNYRDKSESSHSDRGLGGWKSSNNTENQGGWGSTTNNENQGGWGSSNNSGNQGEWGSTTNTENQGGWKSRNNTDKQVGWGSTTSNENQGVWGSSNNSGNQGGWGSTTNTENQGGWKSSNNTDNQGGWGSTANTENQGGFGSSNNSGNQGGWGSSNSTENQGGFGSSNNNENQGGWGSSNNHNFNHNQQGGGISSNNNPNKQAGWDTTNLNSNSNQGGWGS